MRTAIGTDHTVPNEHALAYRVERLDSPGGQNERKETDQDVNISEAPYSELQEEAESNITLVLTGAAGRILILIWCGQLPGYDRQSAPRA